MAGVQSGFGNYLEEEERKEGRRRQTHMKERRQEIESDECNCEVMKGTLTKGPTAGGGGDGGSKTVTRKRRK
ncbi:hypothetical protein E2C01_035496 [Portunus trituberculatus]|uniref:Uncharacterized protein n=1 Tax=Portunus trituberculatus TaxID=210409 RepID=A0A5B7F9X4_PORTR|nr:hypothetical protein [Portunus trituberculatus]